MSQELTALLERIAICRRCAEAGYPVQAPPIVAGAAGARLMIVGQAPGRVEASQTHRPFSGPAGKRLFRWLAQAGWSEEEFRRSNYMTAITKCFPGNNANGRGDRVPSKAEQALCRPWLEQELALVQPRVVVPVGGLAIARFLGHGLKLTDVVGRLLARPVDDQRLTPWAREHLPQQACLVPLPHPSGASQWFNQAEHRALLAQALDHLSQMRNV